MLSNVTFFIANFVVLYPINSASNPKLKSPRYEILNNSDPRYNTSDQAFSSGVIDTLLGLYALSPEGVKSSGTSFPLRNSHPGLYYPGNLEKHKLRSVLGRNVAQMKQFPLWLSVIAGFAFILQNFASPRIKDACKRQLISLFCELAVGLLLWSFGMNAKGEAMIFLGDQKPISSPSELVNLLASHSARLEFSSRRSATFSWINTSEHTSLRQIAATFKDNPPIFGHPPESQISIFKVGQPSGWLPCQKEATWMKELTKPTWFSFYMRNDTTSRSAIEKINRIAVTWALDRYIDNGGRIRYIADRSKEGCLNPIQAYGPLDFNFIVDVSLIFIAIPTVSIIGFTIEVLYFRFYGWIVFSINDPA